MTLMLDYPYVVFNGDEYVILFKPPFMHSAPLKQGESGVLSSWCGEHFPGFLAVRGNKAIEGGLLHRLDYETSGLVFAALTQRVLEAMLDQQERGLFIKEYEAVASKAADTPPGFPPRPVHRVVPPKSRAFRVESGFRYYGVGRKSVRPVPVYQENPNRSVPPPAGNSYKTEILGMTPAVDLNFPKDILRIRLRLTRGFRHQIRCHLAWVGLPILGDTLYGGEAYPGPLKLNAVSLAFTDPLNGAPMNIEFSGDSE
ncbi:MAG: RNA pseudouridine synthase [Spirochaetaceae bacterium]|nr:RNA pseudouridine synthase [Spirochaetaceae bacterium]